MKVKEIVFILLSFGLILNSTPVNSQEVIDDYYLQQLQQLDGKGNAEWREFKENSASYREAMNNFAESLVELGCPEEAEAIEEVLDAVLINMTVDAVKWGSLQVKQINGLCQLRMISNTLN